MVEQVRVTAPAKINLTLHVTGRTPEGYHLLDSLTGFASVGDTLTVRTAPEWSLSVSGPFAEGVPVDESNLVLRAAHLIGGAPAAIHLEKHLPHAAGIGGGSADAAATLRALTALDGRPLPEAPHQLGADLPACLASRPLRFRGIGEQIDEVEPFPPVHLCLVNPGVPIPTRDVFSALLHRDNAPMPENLPPWPDTQSFATWIGQCRNDLEDAARRISPTVGETLSQISATNGCLIARMSGSGATCFGLYATAPEVEAAAEILRAAHPDWWIAPATLLTAPPAIN